MAGEADAMVRRHGGDVEPGDGDGVAGAHRDDVGEAEPRDLDAGGRDDRRRAIDPLERPAMQVIGVRVREQHDVDALERAVGQAGRAQAAQRVERAREERIGEDAGACVADERGGVADERDAAFAGGDDGDRRRRAAHELARAEQRA